jgi:hypothetical protein
MEFYLHYHYATLFHNVVLIQRDKRYHFVSTEVHLQNGRAMAQAAVSCWPLTAVAWVRAQINPVGFVVDKVALGQVFLRVLRFSPDNIIVPWAPLFRKLKKKFFLSFTPSLILIRGRTKSP